MNISIANRSDKKKKAPNYKSMDKSMPENEERNLLLPKPQPPASVFPTSSGFPPPEIVNPARWTAEGMPVQERSTWGSGIFSCLGSCDEFWSSDLEVCKF